MQPSSFMQGDATAHMCANGLRIHMKTPLPHYYCTLTPQQQLPQQAAKPPFSLRQATKSCLGKVRAAAALQICYWWVQPSPAVDKLRPLHPMACCQWLQMTRPLLQLLQSLGQCCSRLSCDVTVAVVEMQPQHLTPHWLVMRGLQAVPPATRTAAGAASGLFAILLIAMARHEAYARHKAARYADHSFSKNLTANGANK